jgi:hypothetical protein
MRGHRYISEVILRYKFVCGTIERNKLMDAFRVLLISFLDAEVQHISVEIPSVSKDLAA